MHVFLGRILVHPQFFEDDESLLFQLGRVEQRLEKHVTQDIDGQFGLGLGHPGPVHGQLFVGRGVQHTTNPLDGLGDLFGPAVAGRSLEEHVFEEVADPRFLVGFITRPNLEHDRHRDRRTVGQRRRNNPRPGRQRVETIVRRGLGHELSIS